ncbi:MAG: hypothetical protein ACC628_20445 [Pirellulaceae bacterium]
MSSLPPECDSSKSLIPGDRVAEFYLLGSLKWDDALRLQRRLVYESSGECGQRLHILFCEHPEMITIGRSGSRRHVRFSDEELRRERVSVRWVSRGGGCVLHAPGQLCVYPIVSLARWGWSVGGFMCRFQEGLRRAFQQLVIRTHTYEGHFSLGGRAGVLAAMGVSVQNGITCHGAFINVNPTMTRFANVDTLDPEHVEPGEKTTMTSLLAERRLAVRMTSVRSALVSSLVEVFDCSRHHIHTHHPLLSDELEDPRESIARAS